MPSLRTDRITIGRNIRLRRKDLGISQTNLANAIGVHRVTLSKIESGRCSLPFESAPIVIEILKLKTLNDLFTQLWE